MAFEGKTGAWIKNRILLPIYDNTVGAVIGAFRGVFVGLTSSVRNMVKNATETISNLPETVKESVLDIDDRLLDIPVGPGFTIRDFAKVFTEPSWGAANRAITAITGIDLQQTFDSVTSPDAIEKRVEQFTGAIADQVAAEMKSCIERCLQKLLNKVPELAWLLDFQHMLSKYINEIRLKIQRQIQQQIDKLIFDKLKLQQVALLKQKILEGIRKMCPCDGEVPPSLVRRLQRDLTWSVVDRNRDLLEVAKETSPEMAYYAEQPNSTGAQMNAIIDDVMADIKAEAYRQMMGFSEDTVNTFVADDGTIQDDKDRARVPGTPINTPIILLPGIITENDNA
jgi:hypothetical protein|tara:strand:- start:3184 stop:4200 length:1017 start_codon:yes stop_codon:yes gene_type:complete